MHNHHNYSSSQKYHDIAMIQLDEIVVFTSLIKPACIESKFHFSMTRNLIIAGFGVSNVNGACHSPRIKFGSN